MSSPVVTPEPESDAPSAQPPVEHTGLHLGHPSHAAAGLPAVLSSMNHIMGQAGMVRGAQVMMAINQKSGFDCPSCAWPDPDGHRSKTEFCENGAKAIAAEATKRKATPKFFSQHTIRQLAAESDFWLEQQGRLVEPMLLEDGEEKYQQITWDEAFNIIAEELNALPTPDDGVFYTSGRASNEAAFVYQLFVRQFGTNNLPDCSNMCHESSGAALKRSVGIGKGSVTLEDIETAETIIVAGQNPGTNHPRMLSSLQYAVRHGAKVIAVNPLKEPGLLGFKHPQEVSGMLGLSTPLSSQYLQVKINGDMALFRGIAKALLELESAKPGAVLDQTFIEEKTHAYEAYVAAVNATPWREIESLSGIARDEITALAAQAASGQKKLITCWAMGLTQHKNAVATIQEVANVHLLLGAVGRPGAGLCPVRGHSNVQGDRTMGIFEKMHDEFHDKLDEVFHFKSPRKHGWDVVAAIKAMHAQPGKVFIGLGGNFLSATPDTEFTAQALRNCNLTVHISTKLNRSHLIHGRRALILPCLGRTEVDLQEGVEQFVTVEDSMCVVHKSEGILAPAGNNLRSETAIICGIAQATLGYRSHVPWLKFASNYDLIRDKIEAVIPGFEDFNKRVRQEGGFYLPNCAREGWFDTDTKKANFSDAPLTAHQTEPGRLLLQTLRSHDQFNTTIYGLNDRYRGIGNERRIIFLNPEDMRERGISPVRPVNILSHWKDEVRRANDFLAIPYDTPRGTAAAYFPEANVLVPIDSIADESLTPTSKAVEISLEPVAVDTEMTAQTGD